MDYLGTADYLTSPVSGKVESWTHYNEWGEIVHNAVLKCGQRELDLVKRYATHDYDAVLDLYYAKARMYDAANRQFMAVDPILDPSEYDLREYVREPMALVQYLYVLDRPLVYIDPKGQIFEAIKNWGAAQLESFVTAIEDVTKHFSSSVRMADVGRGAVASVLISAGDSGAIILQALINAGYLLTWQLPSVEYFNEHLKTNEQINGFFLSMSTFSDSYYLGRVLGDLLGVSIGLGVTIKGGSELGTGLFASASAVAAPLGIALSADGVVTAGAGITIAYTAAANLDDDFSKFQCEQRNNDVSEYLDDWSAADRGSSGANMEYHYIKHGTEVGAKNLPDYCRKARAFRDTVLKKRLSHYRIGGATDNVYRWKFNGKYIDMEVIQQAGTTIYKIVSFGLQ